MKTRTHPDPFASAHMRVKGCFCGKPTIEDHDFCFCSPECARADAMRALGGDDSHYRKVVRKAYVKSGAPEPAIYRRKSENHLRQFSIAKQVSAIIPNLTRPPKPMHQRNNSTIDSQGEGCARKEKMFPTLAEVTSAILARKAKHVGDAVVADTSTTNPATAEMSLNAIPLPLHTSTRQAKPGVGRSAHAPALVKLGSAPQQTVPLKVDKKITARRRQPSILLPLMEEAGAENEDDAAFSRMLDRRTEDRPMSPRPQRQIPASPIHGLSSIRRSASFAGWHRSVEHRDSAMEEGESLMELFDQLSDIRSWIEDFHGPAETRSTGRV